MIEAYKYMPFGDSASTRTDIKFKKTLFAINS